MGKFDLILAITQFKLLVGWSRSYDIVKVSA